MWGQGPGGTRSGGAGVAAELCGMKADGALVGDDAGVVAGLGEEMQEQLHRFGVLFGKRVRAVRSVSTARADSPMVRREEPSPRSAAA